ncbi:unnamed protein product [Coregonus sp. 'balchen']|nr:unnamed protein product [Coregonus sp. 'balchen']
MVVIKCLPPPADRLLFSIRVLLESAVRNCDGFLVKQSDLGGDPEKINPVCLADLIIDHSIQVDFNRK